MKINFPKLKFKLKFKHARKITRVSRIFFWFLIGGFLSLFFIICFSFSAYQRLYQDRIFQGIYVNGVNFGGQTKQEVKDFFADKNISTKNVVISFTSDYGIATISANQIDLGYDGDLSAEQAYSIGRSGSFLSDLSLILQAYINGVYLPVGYSYNQAKLTSLLQPISQKIEKKPVDALFKFENNRVGAFRPSEDGRTLDVDKLDKEILSRVTNIDSTKKTQAITISLPIKIIPPNVTTEKVNDMGIKELIGSGSSLFYHSTASRIYNINLAASRLDGVLIAPGEIFSFNRALGDVSAFTGYKQAYIIENGKTVLGDGGGVCQVSTTFFRAILDAGLSIVERHAHAYRVGYYEEDSPPGIDATVYVPSVDLKFRNDTGHYILVQSKIDLNNLSLTFDFYGTKDGRQVSMTKPVITNQTPPPPDVYQDDPTLPAGEIKQTDFAAWGADVYFTRTVTKNGQVIIYDKFVSNYRAWQAIYLKGTKT